MNASHKDANRVQSVSSFCKWKTIQRNVDRYDALYFIALVLHLYLD